MQKYLLYLLLASLFVSCGSSRKAGANLPARDQLKGSWQVTDIVFGGVSASEKLSFTLLDEGPSECLKGSSWYLPNNGKGSYTINTGTAGCSAGERGIVWSYQKESDKAYFLYKRMEAGIKAKDIADGYRFEIVSVSDTELVLQSAINYQGNPITITYTLARV